MLPEPSKAMRLLELGCLVLIVGPSGAGKDTLIAYARAKLAGHPRVHFARRIITRPAEPAFEDHITVTEQEFRDMRAKGCFALSWDAHGLNYGIPAEVDARIAAGQVIVTNGSRSVIGAARQRYRDVLVVRVMAPPGLLAERLSRRGRETQPEIVQRLARYSYGNDRGESIEITNDDTPEAAGRILTELLLGRVGVSTFEQP